MALIRGLKGKFPCPICLVPRDEQSANRVFALRTTFNSQHVLRTARAKHTEKEREEDLKAYSLRNVEVCVAAPPLTDWLIHYIERMYSGKFFLQMFIGRFLLTACI
jgi:hypothetical protein